MMIHASSTSPLRLSLVLLSILLVQYSLSVLVTCIGDRVTFDDVHRLPSSSAFPSAGTAGDQSREVVFDVVRRHDHVNIVHRQSSQNVNEDVAHTETRSENLIQASLKRGLLREESLNRAITDERSKYWGSIITSNGSSKQRKLMAEETLVAAGGEYMVQMQIGTPPQPVLLVLDTGSGLTWIQCKQCLQCSCQQEPLFDPSASSTYSSPSCQSPYCLNSSSQFQCNTINNTCEYGVRYGQSTFTTGVVSTDTLQTQNRSLMIPGFLFGCALFSAGDFVGSSGLLGLSRSNISFPSQLGVLRPALGRKFAMCLAGLAQNLSATGFISFGNSSTYSFPQPPNDTLDRPQQDRRKMVYAPFAATPFPTQFYYLGLKGISVDGALLPINSSVFELDHYGNGGTVIDSGTTVTLLNPLAFGVLRDAFRSAGAARRKLPEVSTEGFNSTGHVIDTCYNFDTGHNASSSSKGRGPESSAVPSIALHFKGRAELILPPDNVLFPFAKGLYCLAFASTLTDLGINVIGNIQQQNLVIEYDLENSRIGFEGVPSCSR